MNTDFKVVMSKHTDEELIKIVTAERSHYQAAALAAADLELAQRQIAPAIIEQIQTDVRAKAEAQRIFESKQVGSFFRFIHYVTDTFVVLVLFVLLSAICGQVFAFVPAGIRWFIGLTMLPVSYFGYYIYMEHTFQKTLGKMFTQTKVVTIKGEKPTLLNIIRRTICRFIPVDNISFLFSHDGFHDRISETTVIKDERKKEDTII